ncbi:Lcl domain-containing protein [Bordetella genomosp. 4]|uniref:Lcl C-terminal domain-containing protein n=1 Tax=Bordetella genomosp. 4 TaxID=463044 RepID=A0A261U8P6_9BORD|nr:DUF1566 domain-containing protein [Bordetella genomosp. 4]OZI57630.1 hypothetical protein CAL20_09650 [Bordetella genomosp. 4]
MTTIQFDLGGGASIALPTTTVAEKLIARLSESSKVALPTRPKIGEYLPDQGGIFAGEILGDDGAVYGLVLSEDDLAGKFQWSPDEGKIDGSSWDGLTNTDALLRLDRHPAARAAKSYEVGVHADFYLPAKRELQIIAANLPHLFQKEVYWTSTPYGSLNAWAVRFESGHVNYWTRTNEFRVRPVRRFIA